MALGISRLWAAALALCLPAGAEISHLRGTSPLQLPADIQTAQRKQIEAYLLNQIARTPGIRDRIWQTDFSSPEAYRRSISGRREHLRSMLGLVPERDNLQPKSEVLDDSSAMRIEDVTVPIEPGFDARALLLIPKSAGRHAVLIAIPPETQSREQFAGLIAGAEPPQWLRALLARNTAVCIPMMVERTMDHPLSKQVRGKDRRHILHRLAFIVGRTTVGLDVQQVIAIVDWLSGRKDVDAGRISVAGTGQGGMTALYAAAMDERISEATVSGYFRKRENCWQEPVDRTLYGQLNEFGDAEVAALIAPRPLRIAYTGEAQSVLPEVDRARRFYRGFAAEDRLTTVEEPWERLFVNAEQSPEISWRIAPEAAERARNAHFEQLHDYLRRLCEASDAIRRKRWQLASGPWDQKKTEALQADLRQLVGTAEGERLPLNPRTVLIKVTDRYVAYDVLLDVVEGVQAYGQLLVPRRHERRLAAVICQHGLGGKPKDITGAGPNPDKPYHLFGARLAERGYVVFAPQVTVPIPQAELINPIVRQAAALGKMRTHIEVAKLQRIVDFLQSLPFVDGQRIGYYGLSYGGYSAIWMGPLEPRLAAVVISGHFNDWRAKITNEEKTTSYLLHPDEDFYNWDVLHRFTHSELIAAMAPRPVCVEFAERDATTTPGWHARAWSEVSATAHAWSMDDRVVRDHFDGVHEVHGIGTFDFLDRWLRPELPSGRDYSYDLTPTRKNLPGLGDNSDEIQPFVRYLLGGKSGATVRGRFRVSPRDPIFRGLSVKLSRAGTGGDVVLRFAAREGMADIGEARIPGESVRPLFDLWYEARVKPVKLDPAKEYFFELLAPSGQFIVYGPKPLGGTDYAPYFPLAYTVGAPPPRRPFEFVRNYAADDPGGPAAQRENAAPRAAGEIEINGNWMLDSRAADETVETAAADLDAFLRKSWGLALKKGRAHRSISLDVASNVPGVTTREGYRLNATKAGISITASRPEGVLRGVFALEDMLRLRRAPLVAMGERVSNARFERRVTTSILPGGDRYTETSRPLLYTDGLLARIARDGFNAIWVWLNTEEATADSAIFPELNDPEAPARFARLQDVTTRARRFGINVYIYLANGYNHHLPASFFAKHPDVRGYGWGPPMCTSVDKVRKYYAETVQHIFRAAPGLKGMVVIYDSEGFFYCGNTQRNRQQCPRCSKSTNEALAAQILTTLNDALHAAGGSEKELIAWNYGTDYSWLLKLIPMLPRDILLQSDFSKGGLVERDGIRHYTGDYNLTLVGPPDHFAEQYRKARESGSRFVAKTEHAVSQEFIFVPYIPAMEQWYRRIAKIREFQLAGWFGNWSHYGYTPSIAAQLINLMSFDPAPSGEDALRIVAERNFGSPAAPAVVRAWHHFSDGIRQFPYSDAVSRLPGPLQKGPSHPLFEDPSVPNFGLWRSWQNDLKWTRPWGPDITRKYLSIVEGECGKGLGELEAARSAAHGSDRERVDAEWRVAATIRAALRTTLNLIDWIEARDRYLATKSAGAAARMESIALAERENAAGILPILEADSRLGYASEGGGVVRAGLFTPELVQWKLGDIDDLLIRRLPALTGRPAAFLPRDLEDLATQ